ncbi:hypothetical protein VTK73DRAFT_9085 [Phialemonium thermophilum]|uniref:HbrB-like protein n=1 Tax=Phialemonium thermophilum TaxID=223376 RepID=A0ABR3XM97_9PEZI
MQSGQAPSRAPGRFSPLLTPGPRRNEQVTEASFRPDGSRTRSQLPPSHSLNQSSTPIYHSFTSHSNSSSSSLQSFPRSGLSPAAQAAARSVAGAHAQNDMPRQPPSLLGLPPSTSPSTPSFSSAIKGHSRKHSATAGSFDSTLPSANISHLRDTDMAQASSPSRGPSAQRELSTSQIAAQAAVMHHQSQQQQQHTRQRSQTVPVPGTEHDTSSLTQKRGSGGPLSPPLLSLTEASGPRESGFEDQSYQNGLLGSHTIAATTAANLVFPRSGQTSPGPSAQDQPLPPLPPPPAPPASNEKPTKPEKAKVKLFSRPGKVSTKGDVKDKPLPSPSKLGQALSSLQRGNFSTTSLDSTAQSFYTQTNSSAATIRPIDSPVVEKETKEKKHHFLSRQKHKLKEKDDYHLPLSSASSNSRPTDPSAPTSLYNFNIPTSPAPGATSFKSMSGLDLRHGGRALREKKKEERPSFDEAASSYNVGGEWPGPNSVNSTSGIYLHEPFDGGKYGLNSMTADDAWPFLKAKLLVIFEGEDLRLPIEDFNRIVTLHIQYCIARRSPNIIVDDLRDLLATGFSSLDRTLRNTPEDRLIPALVELWIFTFTSILPYMQAVFLPLDLEFCGNGSLLTPEQARDFWGGVVPNNKPAEHASTPSSNRGQNITVAPVSSVLEVRRIVLISYRDIVILQRYETLKSMFSRLSLEFLPQSLASMALASPIPVQSPSLYGQGQYTGPLSTSPSAESTASVGLTSLHGRPGTAMSLDPSVGSYNSAGSTLLGEGSATGSGSRSRAISNVSFGSDNTNNNGSFMRSNHLHVLGHGIGGSSMREQNVEDSKQVTEMVGRMLQCMSVLASVGVADGGGGDDGNKMIEELNKLLKLNWLGRGRTGRNRRGIVGGRVRRGVPETVYDD